MKKKRYVLLLALLILGAVVMLAWQASRISTAKIPALPNYPLLTQQQLKDQVLSYMIFVQGGSYQMGTDDQKYMTGDNSPAHHVMLSSFYMSKYLTSGQQLDSYYQLTNQSGKIPDPRWFDSHGPYPATAPWGTANQYCEWLGQITGLSFTLPTEAQWEYAARDGGKDIPYSTDNGQLEMGKNYPDTKDMYVNGVDDNNWNNYAGVLFVTRYPINMIGIHQMGGNVSEWMKDWYSASYYSESVVDNPQGPAHMNPEDIQRNGGGEKVLRGFALMGYGDDDAQFQDMTVYARSSDVATGSQALVGEKYGYTYGFRCVINSDKPLSELKAESAMHQQK